MNITKLNKRLLKSIPIFSNLDDNDLEYIKNIATIKYLNKNQFLFYQGDKPTFLHIVLSGCIEVYKVNTKGSKISLKKFSPFSFVAEVSNYNNINFPASAVCIEDSIVMVVDYSKFEEKLLYHPTIAPTILKSMAQKILSLEKVISENLTMNATQRIAKYIYENNNCLIEQKHNVIAKKLNITSVTLSRILKTFKNEKIIDSNNYILNIGLLKKTFS